MEWSANQTFLDNAIARGDKIILNDTVKSIEETSDYFRKELDYLTEKGYQLSEDGKAMIKPE